MLVLQYTHGKYDCIMHTSVTYNNSSKRLFALKLTLCLAVQYNIFFQTQPYRPCYAIIITQFVVINHTLIVVYKLCLKRRIEF